MINYKLTRDIKDFYHNNLKNNKVSEAINFLNKKMIAEETINDFEVGLALSGNELSKYLLDRGYSKKEMIDTKLIKESNNELIDVICEKIIIPIIDETGRCAAITEVNYNGIDACEITHQFDDSRVVIFNYSRCKQSKGCKMFWGTKMAVLQMYSFGIKNCFSTRDLLISDEEIEYMKRITLRIVLELKKNNTFSKYVTFYNSCRLLENNVKVIISPTSS